MASITTVTAATIAGLDITTPSIAAAATQTFSNTGKPGQALVIKNANAGTVVATIVGRQLVSDGSAAPQTVKDRTISIATGKTYIVPFGPLSQGLFNDANNETTVTFDVFSSVTLQLIQLN